MLRKRPQWASGTPGVMSAGGGTRPGFPVRGHVETLRVAHSLSSKYRTPHPGRVIIAPERRHRLIKVLFPGQKKAPDHY